MTTWTGSAPTPTLTGLAAATTILDQSLTGAQLTDIGPGTIVRTRGYFACRSDQLAAAEEVPGAFGFSLNQDAARIAGIGSMLHPWTDSEEDVWFVHQFYMCGVFPGTSVGGNADAWFRYPFDSKAQRKFADGDSLNVIIENGSTAMAIRYLIAFRMLIKLH